MKVELSVIVPVRDGSRFLRRTLPALLTSLPPQSELLVCDDGSSDGSGALAARLGARVVPHATSTGPAAARNRGARQARGDVLVFLDADVLIHAKTLATLTAPFADHSVTATFGSYDDSPAGHSWVCRYKNLAHHFVHQRSHEEASTFWAGCGAVRRHVFLQAGGFDEAYRRPSIEDVELGYRLREAGHRIRLVKEAQVTHLKEWSLWRWLASDLRDRALPWARLVRAGRGLPSDLNFTRGDRAATALLILALIAAVLAPWHPRLLAAGGTFLVASLAFEWRFLAFAARRESLPFGMAAAGFHLLHRIAGTAGFAVGLLTPRPASCLKPRPEPKIDDLKIVGGH